MTPEARQELELIRGENDGFLRPQDVVEYARSADTALHEYFEWSNDIAAEKYRIAQARALIRVAVIVEERTSEKVRAYVSLSSDRSKEGGYRALAEVIDDEVLTETLLTDAMKELAAFQRRYNRLKAVAELGGLFMAIEDVVRSTRIAQHEDRPAA